MRVRKIHKMQNINFFMKQAVVFYLSVMCIAYNIDMRVTIIFMAHIILEPND